MNTARTLISIILYLFLTSMVYADVSKNVSEYVSNLIPGNGHTEVSIDLRENNKPDYSILGVREILELDSGNIFTQFSLFNTEQNNSERIIGNLGIGSRKLLNNDTLMIGMNAFIDQDFNEVTVKDGISYVKRNKNIYTLLLLGFGMMVFWAFSQPLLPSYSKDVLNLGGSGYAILNGLYFSGSMIGSLLITFSIIKIKKSRILFLSALLFSIFHILLYNSNEPILSGILIVASGVSHSVWWVSILVYLQTIPDEKYKGRVVGFYFSLLVSVSIGSILGGLISEFIGVRPTVYLAMACLMAIHSIAFMSSKLRKLNLLEKESY